MNQQEMQQNIADFKKNKEQLASIGSQKQQLQFQTTALNAALEELAKTSEKKAYKAVGNILILCDVKDLQKEISEQKETIDLRIKSLQKQEDSLVEKLNKLKYKIEDNAKQQANSSNFEEETKILSSKNEKNTKKATPEAVK